MGLYRLALAAASSVSRIQADLGFLVARAAVSISRTSDANRRQ